MSSEALIPSSIDQLCQVIDACQHVIPVGNETKAPLSQCGDVARISLKSIRGITQYEPSEFTFTALAGTPVAEIIETLEEKGQYLPFDPMLVASGATIGGTVAANLSGPGRFRYGGVRDFLLAVNFISSDGKTIRAGGKVVKNAAGFDLPKFLVGSMGRFGVMTELTFKVFPKPSETKTLAILCESHDAALQRISHAASSTWELDAIDYRPSKRTMYLRIGGPSESNQSIAKQIKNDWGDDVSEPEDAGAIWDSVRELSWSNDSNAVAKVPITPTKLESLCETLESDLHVSAAANIAWVAFDSQENLCNVSDSLGSLDLGGLLVTGQSVPCQIGNQKQFDVTQSLKKALDPNDKFPA